MFRRSSVSGVAVCAVLLTSSLPSASGGQVADTKFKYERGFYDAPFAVVIQSWTDGARIRYTTDGSAPTPEHGLGDSNPVVVPIETTTTLRAIAYRAGLEPSNVDTQTYIFLRDVLRQPRHREGLPTSIVSEGMGYLVDLDYEMDPEIVNHVDYRREILRGLQSIPTMSIVMDEEHLFGQKITPQGILDRSASGIYFGSPAESVIRPASVELIYPGFDGKGFQIDCAIQSHASYGVKRSLKLRFQREYGPGKLQSTIFRRAPLNGDSAVTEFDRLVLRAGHTRSWAAEGPERACYTRDQWVRDSQIAMSGIGAHGTFVHLYLNGLYWGLYNVVERPDAWFSTAYRGGEKEDWLGVNHNGVMHGDDTRWRYLTDTLAGRDMSEPKHYAELRAHLDVEQFADYLILGWYSRLDDWGPKRNWYGGNRNAPPGLFQFYMWDAEYSLFAGAEPMAWVHRFYRAAASRSSSDMVGLWHSLSESPDFMMLFADRVYFHLFHGALTEERAVSRWRTLNDFVDSAIIGESARWGDAREVFGEPTRTRNGDFRPQVKWVIDAMTGNVPHFVEVLRRESYYPAIDPPVLRRISRSSIEILHEAGAEIYYTLDGSDPRLPGGDVSPTALAVRSGDGMSIASGRAVKARAKEGAQWSALNRTDFP